MARQTTRIVQNNIQCDGCEKDGNDITGIGMGYSMKEITDELKKHGWIFKIGKYGVKYDLCEKCKNLDKYKK